MNKAMLVLLTLLFSCCNSDRSDSSDETQRKQQESLMAEATAQTGMPNVKNFRERKLVKDLYELRDQENLATYTYVFSEQTGKWVFFCNSIGYGVPYALQYTNPMKMVWKGGNHEYAVATIPQADPNGLFSPADAEGTWIMCKDPQGQDVKPVYLEPRIIVSPFDMSPATEPTGKK